MIDENFKVRFINLKYLEDFEYDPRNHVHLIIGENGAGKSLIMKHIRFLSYIYLQRIDLLNFNINKIYDFYHNDISLNNIILTDNKNNEFGYELYSFYQVYSVYFNINKHDNILKLKRIKIEWRYNDERREICQFKFLTDKEDIRGEIIRYTHIIDDQQIK